MVNPPDACVINGDNETFEATVQGLENTAVTWALEPLQPGGAVTGNITQSGVFTAPSTGRGAVMVVATSQENPEIVGKTEVEVGSCSCYCHDHSVRRRSLGQCLRGELRLRTGKPKRLISSRNSITSARSLFGAPGVGECLDDEEFDENDLGYQD